MFDVNQLTLGEVATIEKLSGQSITQFGADDSPQGSLTAALAYVVKRRTGFPMFTWNEAQGLTMTEAAEIIGLDTDDEEAGADDGAEDDEAGDLGNDQEGSSPDA